MKILIVDDEKLTREGLISSIDWNSLGIIDILQADDGIHGLYLAKQELPEIILSDVRMPRMDGIVMAEKLQKILPTSSIIFMSGYSDKEYLKAAIKLKAINYVEKPIDPAEVTESILEAIASIQIKQNTKESQDMKRSQSYSSLALKALKRHNNEEWQGLILKTDFSYDRVHETCFFTLMIKLHNPIATLPEGSHDLLFDGISHVFKQNYFKEMHTVKQDSICIYHLWGSKIPSTDTIFKLCTTLESFLTSIGQSFYVIIGKPVIGIENIYDSYNSAVILMQRTFFQPLNGHQLYKEELHLAFDTNLDVLPSNMEEDLTDSLLHMNEDTAYTLTTELLNQFTTSIGVVPNQAKDLYYKLLTAVREAYCTLKIQSAGSYEANESIWENISSCACVYELHELLQQKIRFFFDCARENVEEHSTIYLIKEYISKHYHSENLSIKDISEYVHLTSPYTCTLFKAETGKTLNQYITEYRITKAKTLLDNPRNKISEISLKVGYNDGNYFGKTFKKMVGLSPSEYREHEVKK